MLAICYFRRRKGEHRWENSCY